MTVEEICEQIQRCLVAGRGNGASSGVYDDKSFIVRASIGIDFRSNKPAAAACLAFSMIMSSFSGKMKGRLKLKR